MCNTIRTLPLHDSFLCCTGGILFYTVPGGVCRACAEGRDNACEHAAPIPPGPGLEYHGGMADCIVVPARFLVPLGDLDPVDVAPVADAGLTPFHSWGYRLRRERRRGMGG